MLPGLPDDVLTDFIYKDDNFALVKDPKHNKINFHYTIWSLKNIKDITEINSNIISLLEIFLEKIYFLNLFDNQVEYFTFPPTHSCLHMHIVPKKYQSHRPTEELYYWNNIKKTYEDLKIIDSINNQKRNAIKLELKFDIGLIYLNNLENIIKIDKIRKEYKLDYILVIRKKHKDKFIDNLIYNYKFINETLITSNNYKNMIQYDNIFVM